ncbi:hypothetical protein [Lachnospira multipara]|uniref:hypothetical protein n=1 Tax=Lachnospira multipara TaxID=28051 RepID=UPI00048293BE|nr:hypothetical protein [Lachnospira multipara]
MKKLNKILLALMLVTVVFMVGCKNVTTFMSYTFTEDDGDQIRVKLKTNDGYKLTSSVPFEVKKDSDTITSGGFIYANQYEEYVKVAKSDPSCTVIDEGKRGNINYLMWNYNDTKYNCVIQIKDANIAILLNNTISEESAKEVLNRLDFELLK